MNREQWLEAAVQELRATFEDKEHPLPEKIRVSCGFPSQRARSKLKAIGEHWHPRASADGTHEIMISPVVADATEVLAILIHELCHAVTLGDGHGKKFTRAARAFHLEGKPTATVAGDAFKQAFADLTARLGEYPHAALNVGDGLKKQSTRMLKACCPDCGYTVRLTAKWVQFGLPICPVDGLELELGE